ncbi:MAG TPA: hypothetical protein PLY04_17305 [bacterium]|nr:hypothetical protein [bacterium]
MRRLLLLLAFIPMVYSSAIAQTSAGGANNFSRQIALILGKNRDLRGLPEAKLKELALAHMNRGALWRDLARLQAVVGRDYHAFRDTSRAAAPSVYNRYFFGRYLYACKDYESALKAFRRCTDTAQLPDTYRALARLWAGASAWQLQQLKEAQSWWDSVPLSAGSRIQAEKAYIKYSLGQGQEIAVAPGRDGQAAEQRLQLWSALRRGQFPQTRELMEQLCREITPDQVQSVKGLYKLRFFDPMTLEIMAEADYALAGEVFSQRSPLSGQSVMFGSAVCAYESGDLARAGRLFAELKQSNVPIYTGAIAAAQGRLQDAEAAWATVLSSKTPNLLLEWISIAGHYHGQGKTVQRIYEESFRARAGSGALQPYEALILGRAFLQANRIEQALNIMTEAYPAQYHNQVEEIAPSFLTVFASTKYLHSRLLEGEVLGHISAVEKVYPAASAVQEMTQLALVPAKAAVNGDSRTRSK